MPAESSVTPKPPEPPEFLETSILSEVSVLSGTSMGNTDLHDGRARRAKQKIYFIGNAHSTD